MSKYKYEIIKTKDPEVIRFILPLAKKLIDKNKYDYSLENFAQWCRAGISNSCCGFWVCTKTNGGKNRFLKEDKKLVGYSIAVMMSFIGNEQIFIYHLYSDDKNRKVAQDLFEAVCSWGKENGVKKVSALVKKPKGMAKIFNAKIGSTMLFKEI